MKKLILALLLLTTPLQAREVTLLPKPVICGSPEAVIAPLRSDGFKVYAKGLILDENDDQIGYSLLYKKDSTLIVVEFIKKTPIGPAACVISFISSYEAVNATNL